MKVIGAYNLSSLIEKEFNKNIKTIFIRINPYPLDDTLKEIYNNISDLSWINRYDNAIVRQSAENRAKKTIEDIAKKLKECSDDKVSSDAGEYIISVLGKKSIVEVLNYVDIPLDEIRKEKKSGNPGFDFHNESDLNRIIFGEAKYTNKGNAYNKALSQINDFIINKKDLDEILDLEEYVSQEALLNFEKNNKGFAAAFSSTKLENKELVKNILNNDSFKKLLDFDELILVAVDINE